MAKESKRKPNYIMNKSPSSNAESRGGVPSGPEHIRTRGKTASNTKHMKTKSAVTWTGTSSYHNTRQIMGKNRGGGMVHEATVLPTGLPVPPPERPLARTNPPKS